MKQVKTNHANNLLSEVLANKNLEIERVDGLYEQGASDQRIRLYVRFANTNFEPKAQLKTKN